MNNDRQVLVPHTGPNAIFQFDFDARTGQLKSRQPDRWVGPPQSGPRHTAMHPKLPVAYCDNEQGSSLTRFTFDARGSLEPQETVSTLPAGYTESNSCARMQMSADGSLIHLTTGEWREVKSVAVGEFALDEEQRAGEQEVKTTAISYFTRSYRAREFERYALGELHRRGLENAATVVAVNVKRDVFCRRSWAALRCLQERTRCTSAAHVKRPARFGSLMTGNARCGLRVSLSTPRSWPNRLLPNANRWAG